jgi:hypothetical protein
VLNFGLTLAGLAKLDELGKLVYLVIEDENAEEESIL